MIRGADGLVRFRDAADAVRFVAEEIGTDASLINADLDAGLRLIVGLAQGLQYWLRPCPAGKVNAFCHAVPFLQDVDVGLSKELGFRLTSPARGIILLQADIVKVFLPVDEESYAVGLVMEC